MSNIETGGPAFPILAEQDADGWAHVGMSLRDYFAAQAVHAVSLSMNQIADSQDCRRIAFHAYLMADEMLEARK